MDRALYLAMSGAKHNMLAQVSHANNLANVNTIGFRADYAQARSMPVYGDDHHLPSRAYSMTEHIVSDFHQGPMIQTGRNLDVAINGDGWIAIVDANGEEAYTRAGDLRTDVNGQLETSKGNPVLGDGGPIFIPQAQSITVAKDGTISIREKGAGPDAITDIDRIKLVNPDMKNLHKGTDGLFHLTDGDEADADGFVSLDSGFLEGSNVQAITGLTEMIALQRQYEMQVKIMKSIDENQQKTSSVMSMQ